MIRTTILTTGLMMSAAVEAAPGKLTLNDKTIVLSHVYARRTPDNTVLVMAVDRELPAAVRTDESAVREMVWDGALNAVEIELNGGGVNWMIRSKAAMGSMSGSQSPNPFQLAVSGARVSGNVQMEKPKKLGDTTYYFAFPVDAAIETKPAAAPLTPADKAAAQNSAAVKAYKSYLVLLTKGDKAGLMKAVDPKKAKMMDSPEFPQMLAMVQSMMPKNIEVLKATESGETAELITQGNGGAEVGTVQMRLSGGNWVVAKESWKNR